MTKKINTPEEEYLRVLERLHRQYGSKIETQQDLSMYLSKMTDLAKQSMTSKQKEFYKKVEDKYIKNYPLRIVLKKLKKEGRIERVSVSIYQEKDYDVVGKIKNKIVYARKDVITRRKMIVYIYRDKRGMFVSIKKSS